MRFRVNHNGVNSSGGARGTLWLAIGHKSAALRLPLGPKEEAEQEAGENCIMWGFTICNFHQMLLGGSNQRG